MRPWQQHRIYIHWTLKNLHTLNTVSVSGSWKCIIPWLPRLQAHRHTDEDLLLNEHHLVVSMTAPSQCFSPGWGNRCWGLKTLCFHACEFVILWMSMNVPLCMCLHPCICICIDICVSKCVLYTCVQVCIYTHVSMYMVSCMHVSVAVFMHFVCMWTKVCICVYACVCVRAHAYVLGG